MFETKWNRSEAAYSETGSRFAPQYKLTADGDLEQDGEIDTYAEIQSHADSCDIYTILQRYENGETDVLNRRNGQYVDLTEFPTTFAEMHQKIIDATNEFDHLPLRVREEYNFSAAEFIADIGSDRWFNLMNENREKPAETENKEDLKEEKKEEEKDE